MEEFNTRQGIFEKNYQAMVEHNLRYDAGKESWSQRVTRYYDLTQEETNKALGLTGEASGGKQAEHHLAQTLWDDSYAFFSSFTHCLRLKFRLTFSVS